MILEEGLPCYAGLVLEDLSSQVPHCQRMGMCTWWENERNIHSNGIAVNVSTICTYFDKLT